MRYDIRHTGMRLSKFIQRGNLSLLAARLVNASDGASPHSRKEYKWIDGVHQYPNIFTLLADDFLSSYCTSLALSVRH